MRDLSRLNRPTRLDSNLPLSVNVPVGSIRLASVTLSESLQHRHLRFIAELILYLWIGLVDFYFNFHLLYPWQCCVFGEHIDHRELQLLIAEQPGVYDINNGLSFA